jgi:hypothetical protein
VLISYLKKPVHCKYLEDKKQKAHAVSFVAKGGIKRLVEILNDLPFGPVFILIIFYQPSLFLV